LFACTQLTLELTVRRQLMPAHCDGSVQFADAGVLLQPVPIASRPPVPVPPPPPVPSTGS
jgi:hypothetical protein